MAGKPISISQRDSIARMIPLGHSVEIMGRDAVANCETEIFDFSISTPFERIGAVSNTTANDAAVIIAEAIGSERRPLPDGCVYVIEAEPEVVKIGMTTRPLARLKDLQLEVPQALAFKALFWIYGSSRDVEQAALREARLDGCALNGEWVSRDWLGAALIIDRVAQTLDAHAAGSAMWCRNRRAISNARDDMKRDADPGYFHGLRPSPLRIIASKAVA